MRFLLTFGPGVLASTEDQAPGWHLAPPLSSRPAYIKIHTGPGRNTQTDLYWGKNWYIWNNTGDTAILRDSSGHQLDKCTYPGTSDHFFC